MRKKQKKTNKGIEVVLIYKPSQEANFRLYKALLMLISEDDVRNYLINTKQTHRDFSGKRNENKPLTASLVRKVPVVNGKRKLYETS